MQDFAAMIVALVNIMKLPFTIWGFTLSFWDLLIWSLVAGIIGVLIVRFFNE